MISPIEWTELFSPRECSEIVATASTGKFSDGRLVGGTRHDNTRRARITWLNDDGEAAWVLQRLSGAIADANRRHFQFELDEFAERMQIAWYGAEVEGFFDWHMDIGDGKFAKRRKLTIVVQLSDTDSYEGGDLETNADGHVRRAARARGTAVLLPSFVLHRVTPVTRDERQSLTLWAHGPSFR